MRRRVELLLVLGIVAVCYAWMLPPTVDDGPSGPSLSGDLPVQVDGIAFGMTAKQIGPVLVDGLKSADLTAVLVTPDPGVLAFLAPVGPKEPDPPPLPGSFALVRLGPGGVETVIGSTLTQSGKRMLSAGDTRRRCLDRLWDLGPRSPRVASDDLVAPVRGGYLFLGFRERRLLTVYLAQQELNHLYQAASPIPLP